MRTTLALATTVLLTVATAAPAVAAGGTFVDDDGNTHERNIEAIAQQGVTRGCNPPDNTRYCPDRTVTRAQMATFLTRALELPPASRDWFVDDNDSVHEGNINRLREARITVGCGDPNQRTFCPDDPVRRDQMATFLTRALDLPAASGDYFVDDTGNIHEGNINRIREVRPRITHGCNPPDNNRYCPHDPVRRDQMASFLTRAFQYPVPDLPSGPDVSGTFRMDILAVAQGDAAVYQGPCGQRAVLDVNRFKDDDVLAFLDRTGSGNLAWIANTHYDADHLGGVEAVGRQTSPNVVYDRGGPRSAKDSQTYRSYYDWATATGLRRPVDIGDTLTLCSGSEQVTFTVVSAGTDGTAVGGVSVSDENDRGLCFLVEFGHFDHATCGDVNGTNAGSRTDVESAVAGSIGDVEVAKVNHHGSSYSSNSTYVSTLDAEAAIISVGNNSYGHPSQTVINRWDQRGQVYQTQRGSDGALVDGDITVTTDGTSGFTIDTETGGASSFPLDE